MRHDPAERKRQIIRAALRLIAEHGIGNLTIRNLSRSVGVTEAALYYYYPGKTEIVRDLIRGFNDGLKIEPGLRGWDAIRAFIAGRMEQVIAEPDLARALFAEELFLGEPESERLLREMMHAHRETIARHLDEAEEDGTLRRGIPRDTLFRMVLGPVRLLVRQWGMCGGKFDLRRESEILLDTLRQTLGKEA